MKLKYNHSVIPDFTFYCLICDHYFCKVGVACTADNTYHFYACGHTPFWDFMRFSPIFPLNGISIGIVQLLNLSTTCYYNLPVIAKIISP